MLNLASTLSIYLGKSTRVSIVIGVLKTLLTSSLPGGGKGRAAFCHAPAVDREKRKSTDYSEYPLTPHGEMLFALVQSGIVSYPNRTVALQFFETVSRYADFFRVRKECIIPTLEAMVDAR